MRAPPFFVSYDDREHYYSSLKDEVLTYHKSSLDKLISNGLPPVVSIRCLAAIFGLSPKIIGKIANKPERFYRIFVIKKGKKKRTIQAPRVVLKVMQKWLSHHLSKSLNFDDCVYGFIPNKSYAAAAQKHTRAKWVYSIDIENFFPSITSAQVKDAFLELGYPIHGAELVSKICCLNGALTQGSPASPVISNLVFKPIDRSLAEVARSLDIRYTRYADDLVFSGTGSFPAELKTIVRNLIESNGWKISAEKEHFSILPNRLKVHGLLVHGSKVRLTKGYRNRIRAYNHLLESGKIVSEDIPSVTGHIQLAKYIENLG